MCKHVFFPAIGRFKMYNHLSIHCSNNKQTQLRYLRYLYVGKSINIRMSCNSTTPFNSGPWCLRQTAGFILSVSISLLKHWLLLYPSPDNVPVLGLVSPKNCKHQYSHGWLAFEPFLAEQLWMFPIPYSAIYSPAHNNGSMFHHQ
jgi:hypothetical protein